MRWLGLISLIPLCAPLTAFGAGHDYPSLGHIKGYHIDSYSERGFDSVRFEAEPGQAIPVEGHAFYIRYGADDTADHSSNLEIYLNYLAVLKSLKAEILRTPADMNSDDQHALARFYRDGAPIYVSINSESNGDRYELHIVEQKEFQPSIITSPNK
jgi:hypothetical protein